MGAERPTSVQFCEVGVFERSNDHAVGSERSLHAEREDSACLNQSLSFGPARRNDTRGRIGGLGAKRGAKGGRSWPDVRLPSATVGYSISSLK